MKKRKLKMCGFCFIRWKISIHTVAIVMLTKFMALRWAEDVARIRETRNT